MRALKIIASTVLVTLPLAACQTTAEYEAERTAAFHEMLIDYRGETLGQLLREQPAMSAVSYEEVTATRRIFIVEDEPTVSTVYLPPYTPSAGGTINNPVMAQAARNLATLNTVPGVARSVTRYCRLRVDADQIANDPTPDSWRIRNVDYSGNNC